MQAGQNATWRGSYEIKWKIEIVRDDSFEVFLNAWVPEGSKDIRASLKTYC